MFGEICKKLWCVIPSRTTNASRAPVNAKTSAPPGEQRVAPWRSFGERGLESGPLLTQTPRNVATAKTSSPARWAWLEFASQFAIFMGPIGAMLLGSGTRWGFVIGLATQPFWFLYLLPSSPMGHLHRQYLLCLWLGDGCPPKLLRSRGRSMISGSARQRYCPRPT